MFLLASAGLALLVGCSIIASAHGQINDTLHSLNVSTCPGELSHAWLRSKYAPIEHADAGYSLQSLQNTSTGFVAGLALAGPACNAFGNDITNLTVEVSYESQSRYAFASFGKFVLQRGPQHLEWQVTCAHLRHNKTAVSGPRVRHLASSRFSVEFYRTRSRIPLHSIALRVLDHSKGRRSGWCTFVRYT